MGGFLHLIVTCIRTKGSKSWSHLAGDTEELEEARSRLGIKTGVVCKGTAYEHVDVTPAERKRAVRELGAKETDSDIRYV